MCIPLLDIELVSLSPKMTFLVKLK